MLKSYYVGVLQSHGLEHRIPIQFFWMRPHKRAYILSRVSIHTAILQNSLHLLPQQKEFLCGMWGCVGRRVLYLSGMKILFSNRIQTLISDSSLILPSRLWPVPGLKAGTPLPFSWAPSWPRKLQTFVSCCQLNVSVHQTFKCWSPSHQYVIIRIWGLWEFISSWGQSPHN